MARAHQEAGGRYGAPSGTRGGVWQLGSAQLIVAPAPQASGGIILEQSGFFTHAFLSSGTFVLSTPITAEILVVAGGGGGGYQVGGGGGAGGVLRFASQSLAAGTYAVTVGNGGAGAEPVWRGGGERWHGVHRGLSGSRTGTVGQCDGHVVHDGREWGVRN